MGRKSNASRNKGLIARIAALLKLNRQTTQIESVKFELSDIHSYLTLRGMSIDAWVEIMTHFFIGSRKHFSRQFICRKLASHCGFDPATIDDPEVLRRLWTVVEQRHFNISKPLFLSEDRVSQWTNGKTDPPLDKLLDIRNSLSIKMDMNDVFDDVKITRYAIARTLSFNRCYPWDNDHGNKLSEDVRNLLKIHPQYIEGKTSFGKFINQSVFDWIIMMKPDVEFPIDQLGDVKAHLDSTNDINNSWYWPFALFVYVIFARHGEDLIIPDAWVLNREHDLYNAIWRKTR